MTRTDLAISALPNIPEKNIIWLVYNDDMVENTEDRIIELRGQHFFDNYITVKSIDSHIDPTNSIVYYDPNLYDLIGNGAN